MRGVRFVSEVFFNIFTVLIENLLGLTVPTHSDALGESFQSILHSLEIFRWDYRVHNVSLGFLHDFGVPIRKPSSLSELQNLWSVNKCHPSSDGRSPQDYIAKCLHLYYF